MVSTDSHANVRDNQIMRRYYCSNCANETHFENTNCLRCGFELEYEVQTDAFFAFANSPPAAETDSSGKICSNRTLIGCNWLVPSGSNTSLCESCQTTVIIPDLSASQNIDRWARLERAKRLLFYSLRKFKLPVSKLGDLGTKSLTFEFKADHFEIGGEKTKVITGHDDGVITINISEADDDVREKHRVALGEPYRTLVGHFRHEVGHYYWQVLIAEPGKLADFRSMFGDERENYVDALRKHYELGAPPGWDKLFVTSYASSHPWEDFAETWAHYFHIVDGLETAQSYELGARGGWFESRQSPYASNDFQQIIGAWVPLTIAMNAMNRSIGNHDFYPFVLSDAISAKLQFIHNLIHHP